MAEWMSKVERVRASLNNQEPDRVPVGFWKHFPDDQKLGETCVRAHIDYYKAADLDFLKIMCDGYSGKMFEKRIYELEEWTHITPVKEDHPFIRGQVERAKGINKLLNGDCCTFYTFYNPFTMMRFASSDEAVMHCLRQDPETVLRALDVIAQNEALLAEKLITEGGCTGIYFSVQGGERGRFTHEEYRQFVTPSDLKVIQRANNFSEYNLLHCCGWAGDPNRMENWYDYPVCAVNWSVYIEKITLKEGRALFGGRPVFGGFDNRPQGILYSGTREEIMEETQRLIRESGTRGIMLGADCTMPLDMDPGRMRWVSEAARLMAH